MDGPKKFKNFHSEPGKMKNLIIDAKRGVQNRDFFISLTMRRTNHVYTQIICIIVLLTTENLDFN